MCDQLPLPNQPAVSCPDLNDQSFRLGEIRRVCSELQQDAKRHASTLRRYKRVANTLTYTTVATNTISATFGGAAVATLAASAVAPVVSLILGSVTVGSAAIGTTCSMAVKLLSKSITKHERIQTAAKTRCDCVSAIVSQALLDGQISHREYASVLRQAAQFRVQKKEYRTAQRVGALAQKPQNNTTTTIY